MNPLELWRRYHDQLCTCPTLGLSLDISRLDIPESFLTQMEPRMQQAYAAMKELEAGSIANPDEQRQVGHYWLRNTRLAPSDEIAAEIEASLNACFDLAQKIHTGELTPPQAAKFTELLLIGIGGSALGPQLVADALGTRRDKLTFHSMDNTDPDGIERVLDALGARVKSTLVVVISKSGGTPETRNGMLEAKAWFTAKGLPFAPHAVAVTGVNSKLDQIAQQEGWLARLPMFDYVGGRTSVTATVGILPMALQGLDARGLLAGAREMDEITRTPDTKRNPAARLALAWYHATGGKGLKDMVILPYKDRLVLMSRYLQQLVMESLGKQHDLDGHVVHQGIAVYGNKGSTDQHAYVQQLRDGLNNFFATFIVVLQEKAKRGKAELDVEPGATSGDYLNGFWQGTRAALYEAGRGSILITLDKLDAPTLGALIALYERAVGLYAHLVHINAYHQPGVEAGKKAAATVLDAQRRVVAFLAKATAPLSAEQIADQLGNPHEVETIYHTLEHLAANQRGVKKVRGKYKSK